MTVEERRRRYASALLERVARRLMNASPLCSLATVTPAGRAHINHMYFTWSDGYEVFWFSDSESVHSRNLERNSTAAITIYDSHQTIGRPDRGIQLFGRAVALSGRAEAKASRLYERRFNIDSGGYTAYRFKPRTVKLFDEISIAGGTLVTARVARSGLTWTRTEVWA